MRIALSTNWNAKRHTNGESMVDEILSMGFDALELGYNTTEEHVPGIRARIDEGECTVDSVHAYCPVPLGASHGYPELHLLASLEEDERTMASIFLGKTRDFAESMGAKCVVLHAGRIYLDSFFGDLGSHKLERIAEREGNDITSPKYQDALERALRRRSKRSSRVFDAFCFSLNNLLPSFEKAGLLLALENLPSIEGFPNESEIHHLCSRFAGSPLRYWHDMGHGQVRYQMAWMPHHARVAHDLLPITAGCHIHDAAPLMVDHLPPGEGVIEFPDFSFYSDDKVIKVFEPAPSMRSAVLAKSLKFVREAWSTPSTEQKNAE